MSYIKNHFAEEHHPLDLVENLAQGHAWEFDRIADDQITMTVEGMWRSYDLTLAWSDRDETLRLICSFEMSPPTHRLSALYEVLNLTNRQVWGGNFSYWPKQKMMVWRYGLALAGGNGACIEQIDHMLAAALQSCESYYPAFQMVCWGNHSPQKAMDMAISNAMGHA